MPMKEAPSLFARSRLLAAIFSIGLIAIPFDAIRGISALGELGNELSFPFFAAAISLAAWTSIASGNVRFRTSPSIRVAAAVLAVILISLMLNFSDIMTIVFRR